MIVNFVPPAFFISITCRNGKEVNANEAKKVF